LAIASRAVDPLVMGTRSRTDSGIVVLVMRFLF
jgi:hypothetical protein